MTPLTIPQKCKLLLQAFKEGKLGQTKMPEDSNPGFSNEDKEKCLVYFTLPMALNYQRDSYKLWEAVLKSYEDEETNKVFDVGFSANTDQDKLRELLTKYKIALQPNKHINTWNTIAKTIYENWSSIKGLLDSVDYDFLKLKEIVQVKFKKGFPYLSGPKIFNYWCFILSQYCGVNFKNAEYIEIAPDTHITKCSVKLNVITKDEAESLSKDKISERWREVLKDSDISPIDMHAPLWFWSRNGFLFEV